MRQFTIRSKDGREYRLNIPDDATCPVCGFAITDAAVNANQCLFSGSGAYIVVAHLNHFSQPGTNMYRKAMKRLSMAVAVKAREVAK